MKKIIMFLGILLSISITSQSVFATEYIGIRGTISGKTTDITIVALDKDTNINNIMPSNIKYINQITPSANGEFNLVLPLENSDDFIIHSNMEFDVYKNKKETAYISADGSDTNDGITENTPFATFDAVYGELSRFNKIIILDSMTYEEPPAHNGKLTIRGKTADVILSLPGVISLNGDLEIDNITLNNASTIYANGNSFKITDTVLSTGTLSSGRLTVYGGKNAAELVGDTNLVLLGGKYQTVFGGGNGGVVTGNTNVVLGGNANAGDGINDKNTSTISPCYVYGGGNNSTVTGKTSVTLEGNAITQGLIGAGNGENGTAVETNIFINGGKVMNVYGGSLNAELTNCNTHITMSGGLAEGIFGGSLSRNLKGNTYITLDGGNISRRVYAGCYNGVGLTWDSSYHVVGTTTLSIGSNAQIVTYTELDSENKLDCGIYSGSRVSQNFDEEANTLIYLDDCYNTQNSKIGCIINGGIRSLNSWHDYVVKATAGGDVLGTQTGGIVKVVPDAGYVGEFGGAKYETEGIANITSDTINAITFVAKPYNINSLTATKSDSAVVGTANIMGSENEVNPTLWIAVFEENTGELIGCATQDATSSGSKNFRLDCVFEEGKKYIVKAFLWNEMLKPLSMYYSIDLR